MTMSIGRKLALLATAGLMAGIAACGPSPTNEVVVSPPPPVNTAAPADTETAAVDAANDTPPEEPSPEPDPTARPKKSGKSFKAHAKVAGFTGGASDCCKGKNECKGLGGCKTDMNECKGKNDCKAKGGCKTGTCDSTSGSAPPSGGSKACCKWQNDCKGKGGCKTNQHACMGKNDCKGLGGCKQPC